MRQVYALLGLVKRWGSPRVEAACTRALDAEAISVPLIGRMIERATENAELAPPAPRPTGPPARFARDPSHFATTSRPPGSEAAGQSQLFNTEGGVA
jgi:hypothetical protein